MSSDGPDLQGLLGKVVEQARSVQGRVEEMQKRVREMTVEGSAGGGIIQVTATGAGRLKKIRIDPVAVDSRDIEMLEDLMVAGVNDALRRAQEMVESEIGTATSGIDLGPLSSILGGGGGS